MSLAPTGLEVNQKVIVITGAAGFLGSALTVDLSRDHCVVAIDRRKPSADLLTAASQTRWQQVDIADSEALSRTFQQARQSLGRVDFVLHFAAFYHFGTDWKPQYSRTNLEGTLNVLRSAEESGAKRIVFASSIAAMEPAGAVLTEKTPTAGHIPYAKSKSAGEAMVRDASVRLPGVVLRIGGAFSDWCELPPLASLIGLWAGRFPFGRLLVGEGMTGIPYIHRHDVVQIVRSCIEAHETLGSYEVFLASQHGTVTHKDLFAIIHQAARGKAAPAAITVPRWAARLGLHARRAIGAIFGRVPFEQPWMLKYVDRPWVVDTTYTRDRLGWSCTEGMGILDRLPIMLEQFMQERRTWEHRNRVRYQGQYAYYG
jgi:nucleoside-diphosphate-sugar epimerase